MNGFPPPTRIRTCRKTLFKRPAAKRSFAISPAVPSIPAKVCRRQSNTHEMILGKLAAYPRQNGLALALRELGRIERTMFTLEWIQSPDLRRRVHLGLNKGEARNSLARAIFFYRRGAVRDRLREDLQNKASGLKLVVAAIVLWNTVYLEQAVAALERQGTPVPAECLPHLSPLGWEHINLTVITSGICVKRRLSSGFGHSAEERLAYRTGWNLRSGSP